MKTVKEKVVTEIIIKKSRFISVIINIDDVKEVDNMINDIKKEYKDATHYCYAYIINGLEKSNDDGEPSGTAGLPILNVLKIHELANVLCVVIRYFGGIKLGAGGLIRAYKNSALEAIKNSEIIDIINYHYYTITFNYENIKQIDYILKDEEIINKEFKETVTYQIKSDTNLTDVLNQYVINIKKIDN
jgi:uncharacterized YigZ family protein